MTLVDLVGIAAIALILTAFLVFMGFMALRDDLRSVKRALERQDTRAEGAAERVMAQMEQDRKSIERGQERHASCLNRRVERLEERIAHHRIHS